MTSESDDDKFIAWAKKKVGIYLTDKDEDRLFALARRGAEVQWRPIEEDYEGEVLLWPRGSAVPSHFMPIPPPPAGETSDE